MLFVRYGLACLVLLCLLACPASTASPAAQQEQTTRALLSQQEQDYLKTHNVEVLFGYEAPPYAFHDASGDYRGLLVDYLKELETQLGQRFLSRPFATWDALIEHAKLNRGFFVVGIARTEARSQYLLFTDSFIKTPYVAITHQSAQLTNLSDLHRAKVGIVKNYAVAEYLQREHPKIALHAVADNLDGLRKVSTGQLDAFILNQAYATYLIGEQKLANLKIAMDTGYINRLHVATAQQDPVLHGILQKAVDHIPQQRHQTIQQRWISLSSKGVPTWLQWVIAAVLGILALSLLWSWTLRRQVQKQTDLLQLQMERLRQAQKLEAIGRLAGGVAHDINNMLSPILGYAEMLLIDTQEDDFRHSALTEILSAAERSRDLISQLLAFSRKQPLKREPLDLGQVLLGLHNLLRKTLLENVRLHIEPTHEPCFVNADQAQIENVVLNLALNAQDAMPDGGRLTLSVRSLAAFPRSLPDHAELPQGPCVELCAIDSGVGMSKEVAAKIFEPFYSTKGPRGTGLGLATVWGIIKQHQGSIRVKSQPDQGSTFLIYLPQCDQLSDSAEAVASQTEASSGHESILLVEDNAPLKTMVEKMLTPQGYKVTSAGDTSQAMQYVKQDPQRYDLVITDVILPSGNGRQLVEKLTQIAPKIRFFYMSGYPADVLSDAGIDWDNTLRKPFKAEQLYSKIREVLRD